MFIIHIPLSGIDGRRAVRGGSVAVLSPVDASETESLCFDALPVIFSVVLAGRTAKNHCFQATRRCQEDPTRSLRCPVRVTSSSSLSKVSRRRFAGRERTG